MNGKKGSREAKGPRMGSKQPPVAVTTRSQATNAAVTATYTVRASPEA